MQSLDQLLGMIYSPWLGGIKLGLERMETFLAALGNPHHRLPPVIHIAGTNGKGSLLAYLLAIGKAAGLRVHAYSSPHLVRFNERIVIDGMQISDEMLMELLQRIFQVKQQNEATFFESTTAAAFLAFAENPADLVILETGLGGRLDATNVVATPLVTAITPIALDHQQFLGNEITSIAYEKAGIIKPDVPCVVGRQEAEATRVIVQKADTVGAPLYRLGRAWDWQWRDGECVYSSPMRSMTLSPSLVGHFQYDNAATAVACVDKMGMDISDHAIRQGLAQAIWPARLQLLKTGPYQQYLAPDCRLILDGGHNGHCGEALAQWLTDQPEVDVYCITAMLTGKNIEDYLGAIAKKAKEIYCVPITAEPLALPPEQLYMIAKNAGYPAFLSESIEKALQTIGTRVTKPSIICICGSLYLAGQVLAAGNQ